MTKAEIDLERVKRQRAADFACASVEQSGLKVSDETKTRAKRWVDGEIDLAEFVGTPEVRPSAK